MSDNTQFIQATQRWLSRFVLAHTICPFAKPVVDAQSIRFIVDPSGDSQTGLLTLIDECVYLDMHPEVQTSLLIYPYGLESFDAYLDFLAIAEELLQVQAYEGIFQLASFHPQYCFDGALLDDPANYTNRSPYPMLHLLRESSLEKALANYPEPEKIPQHNIALTRQLGLATLEKLLNDCY